MKNGFMTSEFFIAIFAGAITGGSSYLGHPLDYMSVMALMGVAATYIYNRYSLKKQDAYQSAKQSDPNFNTDLENVVSTLVPLIIAKIKEKSDVVAVVAQDVVNHAVTDAEK